MKFTSFFVLVLLLITNTAFAGKINPDLNLSDFWSYSSSSQNESIGIAINDIENMMSNAGASFTYSFTSKSKSTLIANMKNCMKSHGVSYDSIGQAYALCLRKLGWVHGVN